jgi:hypothetical protein
MIAQVSEDIPLVYRKIQGGQAVTGLSVTVTVFDALTGSVLLSSHPLTEVFPGFYRYVWTGGISTKRHCLAVYTEGGKIVDEFFDVDDTDADVELQSGKAT